MKKLIIAVAGMGLLLGSCCSKNENNPTNSYIEVVGSAEKEIAPDIFYLAINLSEYNSRNKESIKSLEQKLLSTLQNLKIDTQKDLTITNVSGSNWNWWRRSRNMYQEKSYLLKLTSIDLVEKVCDKLDTLGVSNIYLSKIDYSKMDEFKKEVEQEAVKKARLKADNLVAGENRKLNKLIYIQEQINNIERPYELKALYDANKYEYEAPPVNNGIDFQKLKVSYSIIARFSIQ